MQGSDGGSGFVCPERTVRKGNARGDENEGAWDGTTSGVEGNNE